MRTCLRIPDTTFSTSSYQTFLVHELRFDVLIVLRPFHLLFGALHVAPIRGIIRQRNVEPTSQVSMFFRVRCLVPHNAPRLPRTVRDVDATTTSAFDTETLVDHHAFVDRAFETAGNPLQVSTILLGDLP